MDLPNPLPASTSQLEAVTEPPQPTPHPFDTEFFEAAYLKPKETLKSMGLGRVTEVRTQLASVQRDKESLMRDKETLEALIVELRTLNQTSRNQNEPNPLSGGSSTHSTPILQTVPSPLVNDQSSVRVSHTKPALPDKFNGSDRTPTVVNWLLAVKRYLRVTKTTENDRIDVATTFLSGTALDWWNGVERTEGESVYRWKWEEFELRCRRRFQGENESQLALHRLLKWKQTGSISVYLSGFQSLVQQIPLELLPEPARVFVFTEGLTNELQKSVKLLQPGTLDEAIGVAQRASVAFQPVGQFTPSNRRPFNRQPSTMARSSSQLYRAATGSRFSPLAIENIEEESEQTVRNTALSQLEEGGQTSEGECSCSALTAEQRRLFQENKCFSCRRVGHRSRWCPSTQPPKDNARV